MTNAFQEQLLKAGLVTKQQVNKVNKDKHKQQKQRPKKKAAKSSKPSKAQQALQQKIARDRELNLKREQQAKLKALSAEIDQMIRNNAIKRDETCDVAYHFEHRHKIHRIYVNNEMRQKLANGQLAIARIEGRYELVPSNIAQKIQQKNEKRVIIMLPDEKPADDEYADYEIPDDLMW